jgi:hypothetical protein
VLYGTERRTEGIRKGIGRKKQKHPYDNSHKTNTDKRRNGKIFQKINKLQYMGTTYHNINLILRKIVR